MVEEAEADSLEVRARDEIVRIYGETIPNGLATALEKPVSPADPERDQALADFEKKVAAIRDRVLAPEKSAYDEAVERQKQADLKRGLEVGFPRPRKRRTKSPTL
jgi:hypothetical protein